MDKYADIRPYHDDEVPPVLARLLGDKELVGSVARLKLSRAYSLAPGPVASLVRLLLRWQLRGVRDVHGFQMVLKHYMDAMIEGSTNRFTVSGLENLPKSPCLLMSNHRDITLDPALVNYARYHNGFDTVRIAIGDNLLAKPFAADLMRLNKSFIVRRSAKGARQILATYKTLSAYIRDSLYEDRATIWIAQREGRAKNGIDRTEPAIIKMLAMSQNKAEQSFAEFINSLNIVPVSISYEWDPCDAMKARELYLLESQGSYQKAEGEDLASIATGITGNKGHVHVAFGKPLRGEFTHADQVAQAVDQQIVKDYVLHPSNLAAYQLLEADDRWQTISCGYPPGQLAEPDKAREAFHKRLQGVPEEHRDWFTAIYANPVRAKLALAADAPSGA